jgi:hypothetical protein
VSIAFLVITDGRDEYLRQCIASLDYLHGPVVERWMFDDTGDSAYRSELRERYPQWRHIHAGPRSGCAGAFRSAREQVRNSTGAKFLFMIEQDFTFFRYVNMRAMMQVLDDNQHIAEIALRRQPWNEQERAAGGVVEQHPDWYVDKEDKDGRKWLEQGVFYTTNPHLERTSLLNIPWPDHQVGRYSEDTFTHILKSHGTPEVVGDDVRFAYWGARDSGVWTTHIGYERAGKDY